MENPDLISMSSRGHINESSSLAIREFWQNTCRTDNVRGEVNWWIYSLEILLVHAAAGELIFFLKAQDFHNSVGDPPIIKKIDQLALYIYYDGVMQNLMCAPMKNKRTGNSKYRCALHTIYGKRAIEYHVRLLNIDRSIYCIKNIHVYWNTLKWTIKCNRYIGVMHVLYQTSILPLVAFHSFKTASSVPSGLLSIDGCTGCKAYDCCHHWGIWFHAHTVYYWS